MTILGTLQVEPVILTTTHQTFDLNFWPWPLMRPRPLTSKQCRRRKKKQWCPNMIYNILLWPLIFNPTLSQVQVDPHAKNQGPIGQKVQTGELGKTNTLTYMATIAGRWWTCPYTPLTMTTDNSMEIVLLFPMEIIKKDIPSSLHCSPWIKLASAKAQPIWDYLTVEWLR